MNILRRFWLSRDRSVTVANLVDELLRRNGNCEVSVEESGPRHLADLHADICALDAFLRSTVALVPGQPVAIYRTNDRLCFLWFLAVIRAGGIAVPLNPMLTLAEVRRILADSGTEIMVTDTAVFERNIADRQALNVYTWIQSDEEPQTLEGFLRPPVAGSHSGPSFPPANLDPSATVAVFHTSGTSGFPKGAALSSRALLGARASTVIAGLFLGPKDLALVALPWSHIMAVSIALYGLMAGIRGCFLDRFDVARVLDLAERFGVTAVVGVPTMFARLVNSNPEPARLKSVRLWLSASDHLPAEVRQRLRQFGALTWLPFGRRIPPVLVNGYGMVELGGLAMMGIEFSFLPGSGDLCFAVPPFHIRIADENGRIVPSGQTGECQIRRRGLAPHYWKDAINSERSAKAQGEVHSLLTADGWLRTGDLATRNRLGLIRLVGRMKDVIKSGGYSVYVRELEEAIAAHPAVARATAFGVPHAEKGEIPVAVIELREGSQASDSELMDWCRQNLAPYKAPRRIWIIEPGALPQNHTGKVLRRVLRDQYSEKTDSFV
ncbi:MAG TPA: class I adenylate-forming enzyme family protein [Terracidiphilus sp.]|jgi:acyl-CoA synthetase (AMP-forming)/AMP-acid ligase II